jgi:hypothetical protein
VRARNQARLYEYNAKVLVTLELLPPDAKSDVKGDGFGNPSRANRAGWRRPNSFALYPDFICDGRLTPFYPILGIRKMAKAAHRLKTLA